MSLTILTSLKPLGDGTFSCDVYCGGRVKIGESVYPRDGVGNEVHYEVVGVLEEKSPDEFGARKLSPDMAPPDPSIPTGKTLSYYKVAGRDSITAEEEREKHFLTADDHRQRAAYVKGDPNAERTHGWRWARVKLKKV